MGLPILPSATGRSERRSTGATELLDPGEQLLLSRLAVFAGGFSVVAAEAVADAELDRLAALIDGSLLQREESSNGAARFRMLETIREFAFEQLVDAGDRERSAHARFFAELVERLNAERGAAAGGGVRGARTRARQHPRALQYSVDCEDAELALRLAAATGWFWFIRGHWTEGRRWLGTRSDSRRRRAHCAGGR